MPVRVSGEKLLLAENRVSYYLLELHGCDVAVPVLELDEEREPEAGRTLVHVEGDVLPPVLARCPANVPLIPLVSNKAPRVSATSVTTDARNTHVACCKTVLIRSNGPIDRRVEYVRGTWITSRLFRRFSKSRVHCHPSNVQDPTTACNARLQRTSWLVLSQI
jgi:hypothetical protein